jgi:HEAT repeat protein
MPASQVPRPHSCVLVFALLLLAVSGVAQNPTPTPESSPSTPAQPPSSETDPAQQSPEPALQTPEQKAASRARSAEPRREAWTLLDSAISGEKTGQRAAAIRALGLLRENPRAIALAQKALKDEKVEVRTSAALALGEMHATRSVPALKAALNDTDPAVALAAGQALSMLKDPSAYDVYYEVLTGERKTGKGLLSSPESILKDPKKLASIGIAQGVGFIPFGGFGWEAFKMLTKDDASPVRASAARMLASDPDPASVKALENATSDKSWLVRAAALEALAKRNDPVALDAVELSMYDDKDEVQYTAAAAFLRLSNAKEQRAAAKSQRRSPAKRTRTIK